MKEWIKKHQVSEVECIVPDLSGAARGKSPRLGRRESLHRNRNLACLRLSRHETGPETRQTIFWQHLPGAGSTNTRLVPVTATPGRLPAVA